MYYNRDSMYVDTFNSKKKICCDSCGDELKQNINFLVVTYLTNIRKRKCLVRYCISCGKQWLANEQTIYCDLFYDLVNKKLKTNTKIKLRR